MGLTGTCGAALDDERRFQIALTGGALRTDLVFDGNRQQLREASVAAAFTWRPSALSVQVSLGAVVAGTLDGPLGNYDLKPGVMASAAVAYTFLDGNGPRPYLAVSGSLSVATAATQSTSNPADRPTFTATDLRVSGVLGKRLFDVWLPYVGVAVFGGPVWFSPGGQSLTGSDANHYRISVGSSVSLPAHLELFVELCFLGEQALLGGLGWAF
ncbi:MAG: hypothetical protein ACXWLA_03490 [Myxococcaceae bacterium]